MCVCVCVTFWKPSFRTRLGGPFFFALDSAAYEFHQALDLHGIVLSFEVPR